MLVVRAGVVVLCGAAWACGPARAPLTADSEPLPIVAECPHTVPEPDYHVYECAGYAVGVSDEPPGPPIDVDEDLRALSAGFIERVQSDRRRYGARVVVEPMNEPIADRDVRGVRVLSIDSKREQGEVYSANYAVIVGRRSIVCSTSLDLGLAKCREVLRAFVETAP